MSVLLHFIGLFIAVVGLLTVGFAIPLRDFDLGHALIVAGAVAIVGGLIVFALGAVVRELRRSGRPAERAVPPVRPVAETPTVAPPGAKALGRMPLPTPTPPVVAPRGRAEPRLDAPTTEQPQRPDIFATIRAGREPMPEAENVPLSPAVPPRGLPRSEVEDSPPSFPERRPLSPATFASRTAPRIDPPRTEPQRSPERSGRNLFDTVWPTEPRRAPEGARDVPKVEPPMPSSERDEADSAPEPREELTPQRQEDLPAPTLEAELAAEVARHTEPRPISILKSGVIDGMAYTLYTDGSIEAQLPKGMMRFASIDELRQYLEKNG